MSHLDPDKLHVTFASGTRANGPLTPRRYTLTHSDATGDLFLTIGSEYDRVQIAGWYTRLMRDEVLAEWQAGEPPTLHVHCHVSGGLVVGTAKWRLSIFRQHMPMVLEAFWCGDQGLLEAFPQTARAKIQVHFHARQKRLAGTEMWGVFEDYR
jgi:hypothetical protein